MTLWRRIAPTILWVSLLTAALGILAAYVSVAMVVPSQVGEHLQALVAWMRTEDFAARCRAEPTGFTARLPGGSEIATYDAALLPADNGPDPTLLATVAAGESSAGRVRFRQEFNAVHLLSTAPSGPCSLVELRWKIQPGRRLRMLFGAVVLSAISAAVTALLSAGTIARPLITRVQRIGAAAKRVGEPGYRSAADPREDELGAVSRALDGANARIVGTTSQLVERNERLQTHLADIAHDLKTPLTAVQLTLEHTARMLMTDEAREMVARCLDDCVYLAAMVDNLRVGTQLQDGVDPTSGRSDAREILAHVVRRLEPLGRYKGVELAMAAPDAPVWCACRPLVLERVLDNLVYNALGHGRPGDHVAVLLEVEGGRFVLTVLDDGPGVAPEELAALAERTFRGADAVIRSPRGTGLGLAIVAEVCRRCAWALDFALDDPHGLRVTIQGAVTEAPEVA